jgi:endonuclease YncB( thermonuclease family)
VQSITDGDTIRLGQSVSGATSVRFLNIDSPELNGSTQEPWARESRDSLARLLPPGTPIRLETDRVQTDIYGRLLAHVFDATTGLSANQEQLRRGQAVLYVLWPNVQRFVEYRAAQVEAQDAGRGVWQPGRALSELPFEYRRRIDNDAFTRPVGDYFTRYFIDPADYGRVPVNNRVFFASRTEAASAGYLPCPRAAGDYERFCFGPDR